MKKIECGLEYIINGNIYKNIALIDFNKFIKKQKGLKTFLKKETIKIGKTEVIFMTKTHRVINKSMFNHFMRKKQQQLLYKYYWF